MGTSACILVVDDDRHVLEDVAAALQPPYRVLTARTSFEAPQVLAQHRVDVVLLDHFRPDALSLTVLRHLQETHPSVGVIIMTAHGSEDFCAECFRNGARDYLKKPFGRDMLRASVDRVVAARQPGAAAGRLAPLVSTRLPAAPRRIHREARVQLAVAFIEQNLASCFTLKRLAREAGLSKGHFSCAFRAVKGCTVFEYVRELRVACARELLRDPRRSVTQVSQQLGFKDPAHFTKVFRTVAGQPPSVYRAGVLDALRRATPAEGRRCPSCGRPEPSPPPSGPPDNPHLP